MKTKILYLTLIFTLFSSIVTAQTLPDKTFQLPQTEISVPSKSLETLEKEVSNYNKYIGAYPTNFLNEEQRDSIYNQWSKSLVEIKAYIQANPNSETASYLLGELYRQGHNMDVIGAAEKAITVIDQNLEKYPDSIKSHFSAVYFYLSIGPKYAPQAEKSLLKLKQLFQPDTNQEVEMKFILLYLIQKKNDTAIQQIDAYLKLWPNASDVKMLQGMREALIKGNIKHTTSSAAVKNFNYEKWMTFYYQNPQPEYFVKAVKQMIQDGIFDKKSAHPPLIAFLSQILAQNPDKINDWTSQLKEEIKLYDELWTQILLASNTKDKKSRPVYEIFPVHPGVLDMNWGYFSATGDKRAIRNIIKAFQYNELIESAPSDKKLLLTSIIKAAEWSLNSNCKQHPLVLEYCFEIFESNALTKDEKFLLGSVLTNHNPEKVKKILFDKK